MNERREFIHTFWHCVTTFSSFGDNVYPSTFRGWSSVFVFIVDEGSSPSNLNSLFTLHLFSYTWISLTNLMIFNILSRKMPITVDLMLFYAMNYHWRWIFDALCQKNSFNGIIVYIWRLTAEWRCCDVTAFQRKKVSWK